MKKIQRAITSDDNKNFSLRIKGNLYNACVQTAMFLTSETWDLNAENMQK